MPKLLLISQKKAAFKPPGEGLLSSIQSVFSLVVGIMVFFALLTYSFTFEGNAAYVMFFVAILAACGVIAAFQSVGFSGKSERRLEAAREKYDHTWMCLDCGHLMVESYISKEQIRKEKEAAENKRKQKRTEQRGQQRNELLERAAGFF